MKIKYALPLHRLSIDVALIHFINATQPFVQAKIKENIKALRYWTLFGEFTGYRIIPRKKGQ